MSEEVEIVPIHELDPKVFCLVGPSGVGKTTLQRAAVQKFVQLPERADGLPRSDFPALQMIVSTTTRDPRDGEEEGVDYFFLNEKESQQLLDDGAYIEHIEYHNNRYGFLRSHFDDGLAEEDRNLIVVVERHGLAILKEEYGDLIVPVLIVPPGGSTQDKVDLLHERLIESRGQEQADARLPTMEAELDRKGFEHILVNDDVSEAVDELCAIIRRQSTSRVRT